MSNPAVSLPPGFRFHPTDDELILHYLRNRAASLPCPASIIADVDIYKFDPWDLPSKAVFGDREWYFFSPRDRKYPNGIRPNRAAASGYWKATGTDKPVVASKGKEKIGVKKALVFYKGRPPKGSKTDWIMHEYRLADAHIKKNNYLPMKLRDSSMRLDDWVLCRIYKKRSHQSPVDAEREDSGVEYASMVTPPRNTQQHGTSKLPKSCSLSELLEADFTALSGLLDRPSDVVPGFSSENSPLSFGFPVLHQAFNSSCNNGSENSRAARHLLLAESPALVTENNGVKRPWTMSGSFGDGSEEALQVAKRPAVANKFNSVNQPFFNHQLIWNSHFGLQ